MRLLTANRAIFSNIERDKIGIMSFTCILAIIYLFFFILDFSALFIGIKCHEWTMFVGVTAFIAIGTAVLGYLWLSSPM